MEKIGKQGRRGKTIEVRRMEKRDGEKNGRVGKKSTKMMEIKVTGNQGEKTEGRMIGGKRMERRMIRGKRGAKTKRGGADGDTGWEEGRRREWGKVTVREEWFRDGLHCKEVEGRDALTKGMREGCYSGLRERKSNRWETIGKG